MSNSETNPQVPPADNSLTPPTSEDINGIPNASPSIKTVGSPSAYDAKQTRSDESI